MDAVYTRSRRNATELLRPESRRNERAQPSVHRSKTPSGRRFGDQRRFCAVGGRMEVHPLPQPEGFDAGAHLEGGVAQDEVAGVELGMDGELAGRVEVEEGDP